MKSKHTKDNPWAAIDAIVRANPEPTGPEWFTTKDYVDRYGGSKCQAHAKLSKDSRFKKWTGTCAATNRVTTKFALK